MSRMKSLHTQTALTDVFSQENEGRRFRSPTGFVGTGTSESNSRSRPSSPEEWVRIWIEKTRRMHAESPSNQTESNTQRICATVERYLRENPYPPRRIYVDRAKGFIRKGGTDAAEALLFFYETVVRSSEHIDAIRECVDHLPESASQTIAPGSKRRQEGPSGEFSAPAAPTYSSTGRPTVETETNRPDRHQDGCHFLENAKPEELLERLREEIRSRDLSWNTLRNYMAAVRRFLKRANSVRNVDPGRAFKQHLIYLRDEAGLAASTVNQHAAAVSFFFEEVLGIEIGPDRETRMKTGKPLPRVHSQEEVARILKAPRNEKHRLILMLTYGCGLRLGEVQCIKRTNIHLDRKVISVEMSKGKKDRYVMLDDDLAPILRDWLDCGSGRVYLFEGYCRDKPLSRRSIEKVYSAACEKCDIPSKGGIHSLRHSFGTHLLEQGVNLRYIQELLGHSSPKTTEIYTHVAANKISQIRSPIAGMFRREDSKGPNTP